MATQRVTPTLVRPDHSLRDVLLVVIGVAALAMAALTAPIIVALLSPASIETEASLSQDLRAAASAIDAHGTAMIEHGQRLSAAGTGSTDPNRTHWAADGMQMVADGRSMQALAGRLRSAANLLGDRPTTRGQFDLATLNAESTALIAEGEAVSAHGRAMVAHSTVMLGLARQPGSSVTEADALLMSTDAPGIVDAGERVGRVATSLRAFVDQMIRSIAR